MQTFILSTNLRESFKMLDYKRLGKQRLECLQILNTITNNKKAWSNHPAIKTWRHYPEFLAYYGHLACQEWIARGYNSTIHTKFEELVLGVHMHVPMFWYNGDIDKLIACHKSSLYLKDPVFYASFAEFKDMPRDYYIPEQSEISEQSLTCLK